MRDTCNLLIMNAIYAPCKSAVWGAITGMMCCCCRLGKCGHCEGGTDNSLGLACSGLCEAWQTRAVAQQQAPSKPEPAPNQSAVSEIWRPAKGNAAHIMPPRLRPLSCAMLNLSTRSFTAAAFFVMLARYVVSIASLYSCRFPSGSQNDGVIKPQLGGQTHQRTPNMVQAYIPSIRARW